MKAALRDLLRVDPIFGAAMATQRSLDVPVEDVAAYVLRYGVREGTLLPVYAACRERASVRLFRLARAKVLTRTLPGLAPSPVSNGYSPLKGYDWAPAFALDTTGLKSGYYLLELTGAASGRRFQLPFVVSPRKTPKIAVVAQTNTWHAYNEAGGFSNYRRNRALTPFGLGLARLGVTHLPYARPCIPVAIDDETRPEDPHDDHLVRAEWPLVAFADEHGLDVGVYADDDVFPGSPIFGARTIVFNTHNEYWSREMMAAVQGFLDAGGKVVFGGGNQIYREVRHTRHGLQVISQKIAPALATPICGTHFTEVGYLTCGRYCVRAPAHWVFKGCGLHEGDVFGAYSANGSPGGYCKESGTCGASGHETDKINDHSRGFETLAVGTNPQGPAYMVFRATPAGGWGFNALSINFLGALFHDRVVDAIMLNLLSGAGDVL